MSLRFKPCDLRHEAAQDAHVLDAHRLGSSADRKNIALLNCLAAA
jgi:hypothetical protein